jgi:hypothetical protein
MILGDFCKRFLPVAWMERSEIQDYATFAPGFRFAPAGLQDKARG